MTHNENQALICDYEGNTRVVRNAGKPEDFLKALQAQIKEIGVEALLAHNWICLNPNQVNEELPFEFTLDKINDAPISGWLYMMDEWRGLILVHMNNGEEFEQTDIVVWEG